MGYHRIGDETKTFGFITPKQKRNNNILATVALSALTGLAFGGAAVPAPFGIIALTAGVGLTTLLAANPITAAITGIAIVIGIVAGCAAIYFAIKAVQYHNEPQKPDSNTLTDNESQKPDSNTLTDNESQKPDSNTLTDKKKADLEFFHRVTTRTSVKPLCGGGSSSQQEVTDEQKKSWEEEINKERLKSLGRGEDTRPLGDLAL